MNKTGKSKVLLAIVVILAILLVLDLSPELISSTNKKKWSTKSKVLLAIVVILAILLVLNLSPELISSTRGSELPTLIMGFKINLSKDGDGNSVLPTANQVMFPYSVLIHIDDTSCDALFKPLANLTVQEITVGMKNPDGTWKLWSSAMPVNELESIEPYVIYYITVEKDAVLDLSR